jgi:hypothetical protein
MQISRRNFAPFPRFGWRVVRCKELVHDSAHGKECLRRGFVKNAVTMESTGDWKGHENEKTDDIADETDCLGHTWARQFDAGPTGETCGDGQGL